MSNLLDSTIETLRAAKPRPAAVENAVAALGRPHPPRLLPLATGVVVLSAAMLWPRPGNGFAWAQITEQDLPPRYHQTTVVVSNGVIRPMMELWIDRPADASRSRVAIAIPNPATGRSTASSRRQMWEIVQSRNGMFHSWNGIASFTRKPLRHGPFDPRDRSQRSSLESFLKIKNLHQLGVDRSIQTRVGLADRYRLDLPHLENDPTTPRLRETRRDGYEVFVEPNSKRVLGYDFVGPDERMETTIEYPDHFPPETFLIPPTGHRDAYDQDAIEEAARRRLKTPIATLKVGGQTSELRLVVQGARHELWTLWAGGKPNGDLAQKVQVLGVPNRNAYGLAQFTAKPNSFGSFGGHAVNLDRRVDRVDLRIPVYIPGSPRSRFAGYATVRNVAVLQVSEFSDVGGALKERPPARNGSRYSSGDGG